MKAREVKREKLAKRYAHKREEIAAKVKSGEMDHEEAWIALSKLPRNSNPIRQHNRCKLTGRPKGYIRLFGISRIQFREMASAGLIPGVKKLVVYSSDPAQMFCAGSDVPDKRGSSTEGAVACETGCGAAREEGAERRPPHRSAAARAGPKGRAAATIRRE